MFAVLIDPLRPLLHARLTGFWTVETVDRYGAALGDAIGRRMASGGRFGLLVDASDFPIQAAAVSERFTAMLSQWPPPGPDSMLAAVAIVANGALAGMQARRTFGDVVTVFQDRAAAAQWLERQVGSLTEQAEEMPRQ